MHDAKTWARLASSELARAAKARERALATRLEAEAAAERVASRRRTAPAGGARPATR